MNVAALTITAAKRRIRLRLLKYFENKPPQNAPTMVEDSSTRAIGQSTRPDLRKTRVAESEVMIIRNRLVVAAV